ACNNDCTMTLQYALSASYTDLYQITMGQVYFHTGHHNDRAVFDYFFRKLPFGGGYALFAGLGDLLDILEVLRFTEEDLEFLRAGKFARGYIDYLRDWRFRGTIYSVQEGEVVFPTAPVLRVGGGILGARLLETLLLKLLSCETLVATKASRIRDVAADALLRDFGLRRPQGFASILATRACVVGRFNSSSNVAAAMQYSIPSS